MKKTSLAVIALIMFLPQFELFAQETSSPNFLSGAAQYYLGDKDQILMNVNVWGFVRKPGQYVVPRHTDLISLISFAGGPIEGANLTKVRIIRGGEGAVQNAAIESNNGRNGKNGSAHRVPILEVNVKQFTEGGQLSKIPILQAGDTVILPQSGGHKFRNFLGFNSILSIIAAGASVALIIDRLGK